MRRLERHWDSLNGVTVTLWPLSLGYCLVVMLRRLAYRWGLLARHSFRVPVIVVGNLSVGGTGKTPLITRLVMVLREAGFRPGIVSRGYGGRSKDWPCPVCADSDPQEVGDEPVLLARRCRCPVVVSPDRVEAVQALLDANDCDVILCDDGLQHYRLARDIEIAVIDGQRRLGNGACLPAGPLREPPGRLREVDFVVGHGADWDGDYRMTLEGSHAVNLTDPLVSCSLLAFRDGLVHAVAGIGNPARFFRSLRARGIRLVEHPFPDHHRFHLDDLLFGDELPVLMTEKDAVKCEAFSRDWFWYVPVEAKVNPELEETLLSRLAGHTVGRSNLQSLSKRKWKSRG